MSTSTIDEAALETEALPELGRLASTLRSFLLDDPARAGQLRSLLSPTAPDEGGAQDVGTFLDSLDRLVKNDESETALAVAAQIGGVRAALGKAIVGFHTGYRYGAGMVPDKRAGTPYALTVWVPVKQKEFAERRRDFAHSRFEEATHWQAWLEALFAPGAVR
jgi:hypothetical protein